MIRATMDFEQIKAETVDNVLTITLDRPERLNAWTERMGAELRAAFDQADADDDVRAIIVTGAGRGFCAGADLGAGATRSTRASAMRSRVPSATTAVSSRCESSNARSL